MIEKCYLRKARESDMQLLFGWANDREDVRNNSFNNSIIKLESHRDWFYHKLNFDQCDIYIYMMNQIPIGQIRLNYEGNRAVISYSIDKKYRGQGHGSMVLVLAERETINTRKDIQYFDAEVKKDDIASRKKFEKLGYKSMEIMRYSKKLGEDNNTEILGERENRKRLLVLTNNENALPLYEWLIQKEYKVYIYSQEIWKEQVANMKLDFIISYNYKYIINKECIDVMNGNIINLHISYLPWNRGFGPNFWSFMEDTPKGITIHSVDDKLDKGRILVQKEFVFDEKKETFKTTYEELNKEIKELFYRNWEKIEKKQIKGKAADGIGSYHSFKDFESIKSKIDFSWEDNIYHVKQKYNQILNKNR